MSWKSFACLAAVAAMSAPALAAPSLSLSESGGTVTLSVTSDAAGSMGAEITITSDLVLSNAAIANATVWDTANPGDNPLSGTTTNGLWLNELANGDLFVSYGSDDVAAGTYNLLTFDYTGSGAISAEGIVAQLGALGSVLTDSINVGGSGIDFGDFDNDGDVDLNDFVFFGEQFGMSVPPADGAADFDNDGDVDLNDFVAFGERFGTGTASASAVPEPSAGLLAAVTILAAMRRGRGHN